MRPPLNTRRSGLAFLLLVITVGSVGCARWCGKKKPAANPTLPGNPPIQVEEGPGPAVEFKSPAAGGVRRFAAPRAEDVTSISAAPDGSLLAAVTPKRLYLFGGDLQPLRVVELPGLPPTGRQVVALSAGAVAVWNLVPSAQTETRVLHVTHAVAQPTPGSRGNGESWKIDEARIAGEVAFGAAVDGQLVLVVREPATVAVFNRMGELAGQHEIAGNPQRIDVSADGTWAAVASSGTPGAGFAGVLAVDPGQDADQPPTFTTINLGPGVFRPTVALPVGDAVLVAGAAESDRPFAVVSPLAGGDLRARIPLGEGTVVGAALSGSGGRAAVFVNKPKGEKDTDRRTVVLDTTAWSGQTVITDGQARPAGRPLALGERLVVAACHAAPILDLAAGTVDPGTIFPSPADGPCLDGLWLIGDRLAAREGRVVVTWPAPR